MLGWALQRCCCLWDIPAHLRDPLTHTPLNHPCKLTGLPSWALLESFLQFVDGLLSVTSVFFSFIFCFILFLMSSRKSHTALTCPLSSPFLVSSLPPPIFCLSPCSLSCLLLSSWEVSSPAPPTLLVIVHLLQQPLKSPASEPKPASLPLASFSQVLCYCRGTITNATRCCLLLNSQSLRRLKIGKKMAYPISGHFKCLINLIRTA